MSAPAGLANQKLRTAMSYEELAGGVARTLYFRPERHPAPMFGPEPPTVVVAAARRAGVDRREGGHVFGIRKGESPYLAGSFLMMRLDPGVTGPLICVRGQIGFVSRTAAKNERPALVEYSRRHLHALLMTSPW